MVVVEELRADLSPNHNLPREQQRKKHARKTFFLSKYINENIHTNLYEYIYKSARPGC